MNKDNPIENKLVSVIIPTYNAGKYIRQSITSVMAQDYNNWELIVVDDGSTDDTERIVSEFLNDHRICYVKKKNSGVSNSRNFGANLAKGDYFCFLDADDFYHSTNLSEKVTVLNTYPAIALVHSDVRMTDEAGRPTGVYNTGLSGDNLHLKILQWQECVVPAPSSIMLRKDIFYTAGQWDPLFSTAADQDFFISVAAKHTIYRISHALTSYRVVKGSMSKNTPLFEKDHTGVFNKAKKNNLFTDPHFERRCFANLHLIISGSWWNHEKNLIKTIKHLILSFLYSPSVVLKTLKQRSARYKIFGQPLTQKK